MHPTDRKQETYSILIFLLALFTSILCLIDNLWFIYIYFNITLIIIIYKTKFKLIEILLIASICLVASNLVALILSFIFHSYVATATLTGRTIVNIVAIFFTVTVYFIIYHYVTKHLWKNLMDFIQNEKRNYNKIKNYPDLICKKHHSRTILKKWLTFKNVQCRININCNEEDIIRAKQIIGILGRPVKSKTVKENYYLIIWDHWGEKIIDGDFDSIEIYETLGVENYDAIINKIITYFFNEIDRYKPINQVTVKVIDNIKLSESTKRLMERHFLKVEYASN